MFGLDGGDQLTSNSYDQLTERWENLLTDEPKLRIRDAAEKLDVSELELLQTMQGKGVLLLDITPKQLASKLNGLGSVMSLVRNDACVHEVTGRYRSYEESSSPVGLFLGEQDIRAFFNKWKFIYSVTDNDRRSLQVFDEFGVAIIKVYAVEKTNLIDWHRLVEEYTGSDQSLLADLTPLSQRELPVNNPDPDTKKLKESWDNLKDVHQFNGILRALKIPRHQAFSLVGDEYATQLDNECIEYVLSQASQANIPTIEFVQNAGVVQIHTAINTKLVRMGKWYNVLDPNFNLHLNTDLIAQTWAVKRSGHTGIVSSIEAFDQSGQLIIQIFGKRVEGQAEREDWSLLVNECMARRKFSETVERV
ncbi:hemin-degrading factor [Marinomonas balearica]|uniref:Putative hemin transport protein n=1 Tax=Marinomonas balearica TaxID=491947 RepID=A0A4R6MCS7_9GAMM|nr:ChuX/HutX family heme-like substrate-binding protein [Marinomonas balearica]TDO98069.1 putative hemin transport protein [Marinomonas balearica]